MGAAESTGRPNGTTEREEEEQRRSRQLKSGGSFTKKAASAATLAAGVAVAAAAWGIGTTEREEEEQRRRHQLKSGGSFTKKAATAATLAAGVAAAAAAWGISRKLSDNTNSDEENDDTAIKSTNPSIRESIRVDRVISTVTDRGYQSKQLSTWSPPPRGQFKMNTDGACKPHPGGLGGYGGILRNDRGDFVCCFYGFIGLTDSLTAELRGILEGLKILERRRFMGSILETDCQAAYQFVTRQKGRHINNKITAECRDMIMECVKLIGDNNIMVKKIEGKHNRCADKLAGMAIKEKDDVEYHDVNVIPPKIKSFIDEDKRLTLQETVVLAATHVVAKGMKCRR